MKEVQNSMRFVFESLCKFGLVKGEEYSNDECSMHP